MTSQTIVLQSVTGVDVELRIAAAGSRSYAFVIDWHIRAVLALAWLFIALLAVAGNMNLFSQATNLHLGDMVVWLPAALIYFFYHPVLEVLMRGSTPGKRMAGVRIVSRSGDLPGIGALLVRNVFRIVDSLPTAYLLGLAVVIFTEHSVRIGDLAAGTLLVHDDANAVKSFDGLRTNDAANGLSPQSADLVHELLERWNSLDSGTRSNLARSLILRLDPSATSENLLLRTPGELRARLQALLSGKPSA